MSTVDALLLAAMTERDDPIERFISQLTSEQTRIECRETLRLVEEFKICATRLLQATNEREVAGYAEWMRKNAHEVGYRWAILRVAVDRWIAITPTPLTFILKEPP